MATLKLILKKLVDVDVEFVSLVKRGANRLPLRVIKSDDIENQEENKMSFFDKLFSNAEASKDETKEPQISAIIMDSQCNIEDVEKQLEELGFKITEKEEVEGGIVFRQSEFSEEDVVIRLSETTFVSISNVSKAFEPFASGDSFADNFNKGSFFPSVRMATDVLMDTIVNVMFNDDGNKAPVETVTKVLEEFNRFVLTSLKSIPKDAFKLEDIMVKAEKSASLGNENSVKKTEDEAVDMEKIKKDLGELLNTDAEKVVAKMDELKESIKASLLVVKEEIQKEQAEFKADLEALKKVSEGFDKRLEKSETKTQEIEKSVKGTLVDGATDADPEKTETEKSDEDVVDAWDGLMGQLDSHTAE